MNFDKYIERVKQAAKSAWNGVSFSPEKRAASFVSEFENELGKYAAQVEGIDSNKVEEFASKYTDKAVSYLHTQSRKISSMITGPANFPVRSQEKVGETLHKRLGEYVTFPEYYVKLLKKQADKAKRIATGYDLPTAELERQKAYLEALKRNHEIMKEANAIIRSGSNVKERLAKIEFRTDAGKKWWQQNLEDGKGFPTWALSNNLANIKRVEQRVRELQKKADKAGTTAPELQFDGGYVIKNYDQDRLQIIFDGIPNEQTRNVLKRSGYRWSPKNKAWQRQLTQNALWSFSKLFSVLNITESQFDAWNSTKPAETKQPEQPEQMMKVVHATDAIKQVASVEYKEWLMAVQSIFQRSLSLTDQQVKDLFDEQHALITKAFAKQPDPIKASLLLADMLDKKKQEETQEETRNILQQESDMRDKHAASKGGFDFIHEVGYSGKSVIKTYLPLPESRGLKLNGEPDEDGYRMYWATDKALQQLQKDYPNNQYGMGQEYGLKHLNKAPKLKKLGWTAAEMKAINKSMKAVPGSKKQEDAKKELVSLSKPEKYYLTSIEIEWAEADPDLKLDGKKFDSAASFMAALLKVGVPESGYNKVKFHATWDNGATITDRIDVGMQSGDYNPLKEGITPYMDRRRSVMYNSTRDANDVAAGKYTFRFRDDDTPKKDTTAKKAKLPALKPGLFVTLGKEKYEISSLQEASEKWEKFRDTIWKQYGSWPKQMRSNADIVDQHGNIVGYISQNGKVWKGKNDAWKSGDLPVYDNSDTAQLQKEKERAKALALAMALKYKYQ